MTLSDGIRIVNDNIARLKGEGKTEIDGATAFMFYDTYGFPIDLTQDMAEEAGMTVDEKGFEQAMQAQRELSSTLGRGVKIVTGKKKGRIELEYYGLDDLNGLLEALALLRVEKQQKGPDL